MGSLRFKTNLLGILFLVIPALAYQYWIEAKEFIVTGQSQAQIMMVKSLTSLISSRHELITDVTPELTPLMALPSNKVKKIDGTSSEWEKDLTYQKFGKEFILGAYEDYQETDLSFQLSTVDTPNYIYIALKVKDDELMYRNRDYLRIDASDHIRLEYIDFSGAVKRYILTAYQKGIMSAYQTDQNWRHALLGTPDMQVFSAVSPLKDGYSVEIRFPKYYLNLDQKMSITVVDVDQQDRKDRLMIGTYPKDKSQTFNKIMLRSTQLEQLLSQINHDYGKVWILDAKGNVRGEAGKLLFDGKTTELLDPALKAKALKTALEGDAKVERIHKQDIDSFSLLTSAPIRDRHGRLIGAVIIEQAEAKILSQQKDRVTLLVISLISVVVGIYALLFFFSRSLVARIRGFQSELSNKIDSDGRILDSDLELETSKDELGELNRSTSGFIKKLHAYTSYLERMPRVLRHEMHNPLHVIHTSLFNLEETQPTLAGNKYLQSAHRGLNRLDEMVESFTQASSLDDALAQEQMEKFDLVALLKGYCQYRKANDKNVELLVHTDLNHLTFYGNDFRIEQLLDKLIDNAVSFAKVESNVILTLSANDHAEIVVSNEGPLIDESIVERVFDPMFSQREALGNELHLGVGLFIAKKIAQAHHGDIRIQNRKDKLGVNVIVTLVSTE
jgi:signal transduction histidine kinase